MRLHAVRWLLISSCLAQVAAANDFRRVVVQRGLPDAGVADCYVWEDSVDYNGGGSSDLYVGNVGVGEKQTFLQFDLSGLPRAARIATATLGVTANGTAQVPIRVHRARTPWDELTATWATDATNFEPAVEFTLAPVSDETSLVDVTALVQDWVTRPTANTGLVFEQERGMGATTLASSEHPDEWRRPFLDLVYDVPPLLVGTPPALAAACEVPLLYPLRAHAPGASRFELAGDVGQVDADGVFTWTPARTDRGAHVFTLTVADATRREDVTLEVDVQCSRGLTVGCATDGGLATLVPLALWVLRRRRGKFPAAP